MVGECKAGKNICTFECLRKNISCMFMYSLSIAAILTLIVKRGHTEWFYYYYMDSFQYFSFFFFFFFIYTDCLFIFMSDTMKELFFSLFHTGFPSSIPYCYLSSFFSLLSSCRTMLLLLLLLMFL